MRVGRGGLAWLMAAGPVIAANEPRLEGPNVQEAPAAEPDQADQRAQTRREKQAQDQLAQARREKQAQQERALQEVKRLRDREAPPGQAWLGIQLSPVPAALAAHLKLGSGGGLMVQNVHKDSPADKAGLQQYDVIVGYDGDPLDGDIEDFQDRIRTRKPSEVIRLEVRRAGETQRIEVTVGEVPRQSRRLEWRYQEDPDVTSRNLYGLRGRILRPGPDGWEMEDLGDLLEDWGEQFEDRFEHGPGMAKEAPLAEARRVDREGNVLHVRREGDSVIVKRFKSGTSEDQAESKEYPSMDQLREQDREAFDLLQPQRPEAESYREALRQYLRNMPRVIPPGTQFRVPRPPTVPLVPGGPQEPGQPRVFRRGPSDGPEMAPDDQIPRGFGPAQPEGAERGPADAPQKDVSFELLPDGSIKAEVHEGRDSLTATFSSEADMADKAPKLFERWRALKSKIR